MIRYTIMYARVTRVIIIFFCINNFRIIIRRRKFFELNEKKKISPFTRKCYTRPIIFIRNVTRNQFYYKESSIMWSMA